MDEKELKDLYDAMHQNGIDLGDYNSFKAHMATTKDRSDFYNYMKKNDVDLGDYNEYERKISGVQQQAPAKPVQSGAKYDMAALEHAKTNIPVQPQQDQQETVDQNDPLGSTMNHVLSRHGQVQQRLQQINTQYNSDNLRPVHTPDVGNEVHSLNYEQNALNRQYDNINQTVNFGAPVSTHDAATGLNNIVHKTDPTAPDVSQMTPEQIQQYLPKDNLTAQSFLNRYKNNTNVLNHLATSSTVEQAALKWTKENPQFFNEGMYKQIAATGQDDDPNKIPSALRAQMLSTFLSQPAAGEYAQAAPQNAQAIQKAKDNLFTDPANKDYAINSIATYLSQRREDAGRNNGIFDIYSPTTIDADAKEALTSGKWSPAMYDAYQKNKLQVMGAIKSPDILNSLSSGLEKGIGTTAKGIGDLVTLKFFGNESQEDRDKAIQEQYNQVGLQAKGWHKVAGDAAEQLGEMIPLMATTRGFQALGLGTKAANMAAFGLASVHPIEQQALTSFPDDPAARQGFKWTALALNAGAGAILGREKAIEGFQDFIGKKGQQEFTDQVISTIKDFTDGKITQDAAKEAFMSNAAKYFDRAATFAGKTLGHAASMSAQMSALGAAQNVAEKIFGGKPIHGEDIGSDLLDGVKQYALTNVVLGSLAAHADITNDTKLAAGAIYDMASDPHRYEALINNLASSTGIGNFAKEETLNNLQRAVSLKAEMDREPMLENLSTEDRQKYLFQSLAQKVLADKLENTSDNVLKNKIKEQIKQSESFNQRLIDKTPLEVTEPSKTEKEAGVKAYYDDEKNVKKLADKIETGQPLDDEDLQLQKNFKEELQGELDKRAAKDIKAQAKVEKESSPEVPPTENSEAVTEAAPEKHSLTLDYINDAETLSKPLGGTEKVANSKGEIIERPRTVKTEQVKIKKNLSVLEQLINCL